MIRTNQRDAQALIRSRETFRASALSGVREAFLSSAGYLSGAERERFYNDRNGIVYAVLSYRTPIAWLTTSGEWYIVAQRFSVTTSRHQSVVRAALR